VRGAPYRAADGNRRAGRAGALAASRARRWNICLRPTPQSPWITPESQGAPWAAFWRSLNFRARATGEIWPVKVPVSPSSADRPAPGGHTNINKHFWGTDIAVATSYCWTQVAICQ